VTTEEDDDVVNKDKCRSIEDALRRVRVAHEAGWIRDDQAEVVLAAEVRRLREYGANFREGFEREELGAMALREQVTFLSAKLARVEALPDSWKRRMDDECWQCIEELEEVLRGDR